jgi:uncharacterized protein YqhQ
VPGIIFCSSTTLLKNMDDSKGQNQPVRKEGRVKIWLWVISPLLIGTLMFLIAELIGIPRLMTEQDLYEISRASNAEDLLVATAARRAKELLLYRIIFVFATATFLTVAAERIASQLSWKYVLVMIPANCALFLLFWSVSEIVMILSFSAVVGVSIWSFKKARARGGGEKKGADTVS